MRWYFRTIIHMKEEKLTLFNERKQELVSINRDSSRLLLEHHIHRLKK